MADQNEVSKQLRSIATQTLTQEVVDALQALDNLAVVAIGELSARTETRRQIGHLAELLIELSARTQIDDFAAQVKWMADNLQKLTENAYPPEAIDDEDEPDAATLEQSELNRRLALTLPPRLSNESPLARLKDKAIRKVLIGCLERTDETPLLVHHAVRGFDRERWEVFDMGDNVPLMIMLSSALEKRPSVVVLVISNGTLLSEAASLVADLKRKLFGIKVVAVGPMLNAQANVGLRLQADLYAPEVSHAAALADNALSPLQQMGNPLKLDTSEMRAISEATAPKLEDVSTSPPIPPAPTEAEG